MTDNATASDAQGNDVTFRTRERSGVHTAVQAASFQAVDGSEVLVDPDHPLPSEDATTAGKLDQVLAALANLLTPGDLAGLSTEATLALVLTALGGIASIVSTSAKQDTGNTSLDTIVTRLQDQATALKQDTANSSLASLVSLVATAAKQDTAQTTLSAIQSALAPLSTAAKQDAAKTVLDSILTEVSALLTPADIVGLATATKQDSIITALGLLVKPSDLSGLATSAKQDEAKTVLDNILTELGPKVESADLAPLATASKQDAGVSELDGIANILGLIADLLPRINGNKQVAVSIEAGSVGISASQTLATLTTLGTINAVGGVYAHGYAMNAAGLVLLYNQIELT